jgi:hypothetical protein
MLLQNTLGKPDFVITIPLRRFRVCKKVGEEKDTLIVGLQISVRHWMGKRRPIRKGKNTDFAWN